MAGKKNGKNGKNGKDLVERVVEVFEDLEVNDRVIEKGYTGSYEMRYSKVQNPRSKREICRIELKPNNSFKPIAIVRNSDDLEELIKFAEFLKKNDHLVKALDKLNDNVSKTTPKGKTVTLV